MNQFDRVAIEVAELRDMDEYIDTALAAHDYGLTLRRPTASSSLFKYVGLNNKTSWDYFEETLSNGVLKGSTAISLNDPFEMEPCVVDDLRDSVAKQILGFSQSAFQKRANRHKPKKEYLGLEAYREEAKHYLASIKRYYRIVSFCQRSDSSLLWAHYANSYRGACLHFLGSAFRRSLFSMGFV